MYLMIITLLMSMPKADTVELKVIVKDSVECQSMIQQLEKALPEGLLGYSVECNPVK
jgi:hypothetical protein